MKQKFFVLTFVIITCCLVPRAQVTHKLCNPTALQVQIPENAFTVRTTLFKYGAKIDALNKLAESKNHPSEITGFDLFEFFTNLETCLEKANGLRIYIGAYIDSAIDPADRPYVINRKNELVAIFVATVENGAGTSKVYNQDIETYYVLDVMNKSGLRQVKKTTAKSWVNNYKTKVLQDLNKTFPNQYGDTRTIWYNKKHLLALKKEMICQHEQPGSPVNNISFYWANYEDNYAFTIGVANEIPTQEAPVKGMLTLLFKVPNAAVVSVEQRQLAILKTFGNNALADKQPKKQMDHGYYDTGVPCPPADNCGEGEDWGYSL